MLVAIVPAVLVLTGSADEFSFASATTFILGVVGTILVISWLTIDFPDGADRKIGAFLGLIAVIGVAVGGYRAMQERRRGAIGSGFAQAPRGGILDANRLSQGQLVAAISAIVLFFVSFLPWFGTPEVTGIGPGGGYRDRRRQLQPLGG